ncbi:MAG: MBL fold metallo-hydrolase [Hyphomicrobiales bacterium]
MRRRFLGIALFAFAWIFPATPAAALASDCLAMAGARPRLLPAALAEAAVEENQVRLTFLGHSSFLIESPGGVKIVTDYAGYYGGAVPDVATMNRAHPSHFTDYPDPAIRHVLRGWNPEGGPAQHDLAIGDVRIRNVTTDIRGGAVGRMPDGNSIFIFDMAGLCIGHLGHLHHELDAGRLAMIGRLDIVLVPVDGGYTMAQANMLEVLKALKARVVIPMHYFGPATLNRFIAIMGREFALETHTSPVLAVSAESLPETPRLVVLPGY